MTSTQSDPPEGAAPEFAVVLAAAGTGRRMGGFKKPYAELFGRPVLYHCIDRLLQAAGCAEIVPVLHAEECEKGDVPAQLAEEFGITRVVCGGPTRQASALAGLEAVREDAKLVLIHDAARPLISPSVVERVARDALRFGAAIAAVRATETIKDVDEDRRIVATAPRHRFWHARTPQGFHRDIILRAHYAAAEDGFEGTDDAQLVERLGLEAHVVEDRCDNLKITTLGDLVLAEAMLRWQEIEGAS